MGRKYNYHQGLTQTFFMPSTQSMEILKLSNWTFGNRAIHKGIASTTALR